MSWIRAEICSLVRISASTCAQRFRGRRDPSIRRSNDCRMSASFGERHARGTPSGCLTANQRDAAGIQPPDRSLRPRATRRSAAYRASGTPSASSREPHSCNAARSLRSASVAHPGLQVTAAKPARARHILPRRASDLQCVAVGRGGCGWIAVLELSRFAFALRARELRRRARKRGAWDGPASHGGTMRSCRRPAPGATKTIGESDGRRLAGFADEPVDLPQAKRLQPGRQFPAELVERFAPLLRGAPHRQLVLLPDDANDEQDRPRRWGSEWRTAGARSAASVVGDPRRLTARILGPPPGWAVVMEM